MEARSPSQGIITETVARQWPGGDTGDLLTSAVAECGAETWDRGPATVPSSRQPPRVIPQLDKQLPASARHPL